MDDAHVVLLDMNIHSDSFTSFRCTHNLSIGIDLYNLETALNCMDDADTLEINVHGTVIDEVDNIKLFSNSTNETKVRMRLYAKILTFTAMQSRWNATIVLNNKIYITTHIIYSLLGIGIHHPLNAAR